MKLFRGWKRSDPKLNLASGKASMGWSKEWKRERSLGEKSFERELDLRGWLRKRKGKA